LTQPDLVDRNVVVMFLQQIAEELEAEGRAEGTKGAPDTATLDRCTHGARALKQAAAAIERLPDYTPDPEARYTITEQGRQALDEADDPPYPVYGV